MKKGFYYWDYGISSDILNIHKINKKTKGSAELGDFSIDFDKNDNVVGVEILHASEFLKESGINKEQLKNIKGAKILVDTRNPTYLLIYIGLVLSEGIERKIPIPAPVCVS